VSKRAWLTPIIWVAAFVVAVHFVQPVTVEIACPECKECPAGFATIEDMLDLTQEKEVSDHRLEACQETIKHCECE
jgi:hypothetical protein